ncbi:MAG: AMIN domain-containing protein, partial [Gammaproteobacteria bacterium]
MTVMAFAYKKLLQFAQSNRTEKRSGRRTTVVWVLSTALYLILCGAAVAEGTGTQNILESVEFSALSDSQVQLVLTMARPVENPLSFTIDNPARIALDFPATRNGGVARSQKIGVGILESMNVVEAGGRTRVVLNLTRMVPYRSRVEGNRVIVTLRESGFDSGPAVEQAVSKAVPQPAVSSSTTVATARVEQSAEEPAKAMAGTVDVIKVAGIVLATRQKRTNKTPPAPVSKPVQTGPSIANADSRRDEPVTKPVQTGPGIVSIDFRRNELG